MYNYTNIFKQPADISAKINIYQLVSKDIL